MDSMAAMIIQWLVRVDCDISDRSVGGGKNIYGAKRQMQGYMKDQGCGLNMLHMITFLRRVHKRVMGHSHATSATYS